MHTSRLVEKLAGLLEFDWIDFPRIQLLRQGREKFKIVMMEPKILYIPYSFSLSDRSVPSECLPTKVQAHFHAWPNHPNLIQVTIIRMDNRHESVGFSSDERPGPQQPWPDKCWRDIQCWLNIQGWPTELNLHLLHPIQQVLKIPANPNKEVWRANFTVSLDAERLRDLVASGERSLATETNEPTIPYKLFTHWEDENVPPCLIKSINTFRTLNPHYTLKIFTNKMARDFIAQHEDSSVLEAFDLLLPMAYKCDLFRLVVVYHEGGVYFDSKLSCLVPLDAFLPHQGGLVVNDRMRNVIMSSFMALPPRDPFPRLAIDEIVKNVRSRNYGSDALAVTGPRVFGSCLYQKLDWTIQQRYTHAYMDQIGRVLYVTGNIPVIMQYNGEYRRYLSFPGQDKNYATLYDKRMIFGGETVPCELLPYGGILLKRGFMILGLLSGATISLLIMLAFVFVVTWRWYFPRKNKFLKYE